MSLLIGAVLLTGAVVFYVLHPVLAGLEAPLHGDDEEPTEAEAQRRVALLALRDVEFDLATGKLDQEDYAALRREISSEALAALDAAEAERLDVPRGGAELDVEAEVARARAGLREGTTCASCGHVNPPGSRFCSICGRGLEPPGPPAT